MLAGELTVLHDVYGVNHATLTGTTGADPSPSIEALGYAVEALNDEWTLNSLITFSITQAPWIAFRARKRAGGGASDGAIMGKAGALANLITIEDRSPGRFKWFNDGGSATNYDFSVAPDEGWHNYFIHNHGQAANTSQLYVDGVLDVHKTADPGAIEFDSLLNGDTNLTNRGLDGQVSYIAVGEAPAPLSAAMALAWHRAPFTGFHERRYWALAVSGGISQAIGLVTESNTSLAFSSTKDLALGLSSETDSSLAFSRLKSLTLGLNTETDSSLSMSSDKQKTIGLSSETDEALSISTGISQVIGIVSETDAALTFLRSDKQKVIGIVVETDSALAFSQLKQKLIGIASEVDTPLSVDIQMSIGLATEIDDALSMTVDGGGGVANRFPLLLLRRRRRQPRCT